MPDTINRLNAALAGRYRVERELGEGGMATVFLAADLKHGREVALKVLRPELAAAVGAQRFLAEIRTTASLQHPNILPLFDSGDADGLLFYAMPYAGGESLRERLDRDGQLPVPDAVHISTAVADALEYAHRQGVIHRDIKPANILLLDGKPVVADFGIALATQAGATGRLTEAGLSLGTPHYMSPEQSMGETRVGPGTDVWALGCVLYEMLVGEPPYTGSTPQAVLGKIITADAVSATETRKLVPPNVDAAIRRALEKVPADRFASARDFALALGDPAFRHGAEVVGGGAPARRGWNRLSMGLAATTALLAVALVWTGVRSRRAVPIAVSRIDVTPRDGQRLPLVPGGEFTVSPDGSRIVFVGATPALDRTQLFQRPVGDIEAFPILGTEDALAPSFSPDGRSVVFQQGGEIRVAPIAGGPSVSIATGTNPVWSEDGAIYFASESVVHRIPATGGESEPVTLPTEGRLHRSMDPLPGGRGLLVSVVPGAPIPTESRIGVVGPDGGEVREILTGTMARYASTGHVVYATADGMLMVVPFDARRLEVTGPSMALLEGVTVKGGSATLFTLSRSGALMYATGGRGESEPVWVSRSGEVEPVESGWMGDFGYPALSPDGTRLAFTVRNREERTADVWVKQLDDGSSFRLTLDGLTHDFAVWSPDGARVTFYSDQAGPSWDLWTKRADGSGQAELLLDIDVPILQSAWSPDGEWLAYSVESGTDTDVFAVRARERGRPVPVAATSARETAPTFSPDGRWLAYAANDNGVLEVYVVPFPDASSAKWMVSSGGGAEPLWSRDGRELFYRNRQGDLVAVPIDTRSATFSAGPPNVLFSALAYRAHVNLRQYAVSPDGERFLMLRPIGNQTTDWILVPNFFAQLRALRSPAGG